MEIEVHTRRPFGAREEDVAGWHVLHVTGEVGAQAAGLLPTLVVYAVRRGADRVCLDLSEIERVDGTGAETLRRCTRVARYAGGRLAMIGPDDPEVAEVLEDSGVVRDMAVLTRRETLATAAHRRHMTADRGATRRRRPSPAH